MPHKEFSLLREEFYRLLKLTEPGRPATTSAVATQQTEAKAPAAQAVLVSLSDQDGTLRATVRRFAAQLVTRGIPPVAESHLVVSADEPTTLCFSWPTSSYTRRLETPSPGSCACRKLHPRRLSGVAILVDDPAETVLPLHVEVFDLDGLKVLGQSRRGAAAASDRWVRCSL